MVLSPVFMGTPPYKANHKQYRRIDTTAGPCLLLVIGFHLLCTSQQIINTYFIKICQQNQLFGRKFYNTILILRIGILRNMQNLRQLSLA